MPSFKIPEELIEMLQQRRVIPFIGAGFSDPLEMPEWDEFLKLISKEIRDALPYDEVRKCCNDNNLQIAEYYFIKSDHKIGNLRYAMSKVLQPNKDILTSSAHIELLNLGARQIYTTNYDDNIESIFDKFSIIFKKVLTPKDVATTHGDTTQIIKFHGDLRDENTLVLTESSYYSRLDFESPMDVKFRSDILGKSVLFMGYSFRDINIRIIWYKLMKMMKDIPKEDRPLSYIVKFESNPVLETLYRDVGIETIVLDPNNEFKNRREMQNLFNQFMFDLSRKSTQTDLIPGTDRQLFLSGYLIELIKNDMEKYNDFKLRKDDPSISEFSIYDTQRLIYNLKIASSRVLIKETASMIDNDIVPPKSRSGTLILEYLVILYLKVASLQGPSPRITAVIARGLSNKTTRDHIMEEERDWKIIWGSKIDLEQGEILLETFKSKYIELVQSLALKGDQVRIIEDLAYKTDVLLRIITGEILDNKEIQKKASKILEISQALLRSSIDYSPSTGEKPLVESLTNSIIDHINSLSREDRRKILKDFNSKDYTLRDSIIDDFMSFENGHTSSS